MRAYVATKISNKDAGVMLAYKLAKLGVWDDLQPMHEVVNSLLQIHDELLFECREDVAEELGAIVKYRFETAVKLRVPIKAEVATAPVWGLLEK